jgi:general secretion pathway protein C
MHFHSAAARFSTGLYLALIAAAAYFQAAGITHLIAGVMTPPALPIPPRAPSSPRAFSRDHATSALPILERNPFDSKTPRPLGREAPLLGEPERGDDTPPCEGLRALVVVASPDAAWSVAALSDKDGRAKLVRTGEAFGDRVVELVEWNGVVLSSGTARCEVRMFRKRAAETRVMANKPAVVEDVAARTRKVSATEFEVDKRMVGELLEKPEEWMKLARVVPEREDGRLVGVRIFGVRPDGVLGVLGFENGDRVETVNGYELANPENAMQAFTRLREANHLTVHVTRRGKETNLDFDLK